MTINQKLIQTTGLLDNKLSWSAKGLLSYLLSHFEGHRFKADDLLYHTSNGRAATRTAIKELKEHGYLKMTTERNSKGFSGVKWSLINPA